MIENNRVLAPLRSVFTALGQPVYWDSLTSSITSGSIWLQIDNPVAKLNGNPVTQDAPPRIINSRTFVPLSFIASALGKDVSWNDSEQQVSIVNRTIPVPTNSPALDWVMPGMSWQLGREEAFTSCSIDLSISRDIDPNCCLYIAPFQMVSRYFAMFLPRLLMAGQWFP